MAQDATPQTVLSSLHQFPDAFTPDGIHPFAVSYETNLTAIRTLLRSTSDILRSTSAVASVPLQNSKTASMLREHSRGLLAKHVVPKGVGELMTVLDKRQPGAYGEEIPLDQNALGDWFVSRIVEWGGKAGMDAFPEAEDDGKRAIALGGKVLVLDVELVVRPQIKIAAVRVSFAVPSESAHTTEGSASLGAVFYDGLQAFADEVLKGEQANPVEAAKIGCRVQDGLKYLMDLDRLAATEDDTGIRWFQDTDRLGVMLEGVAKMESDALKQQEGLLHASLDKLLQRAHTLPLPYLISPTLSFLVHLSPRAYLALKKSTPVPAPSASLPSIDVSIQHLRRHLAARPQTPGVSLATLALVPVTSSLRTSTSPDLLHSRPLFTLAAEANNMDHVLPLPATADSLNPGHVWVLDFTSRGLTPGVVLSQTRMREIEGVINPLGDLGSISAPGATMSFGTTRTWLDMLLMPNQTYPSPERYTAVYTSPSGAHPALDLRVSGMQEPGYMLERVQVYSMKEAWAIMEIVREQCWLNESLRLCEWTPNTPSLVPNTDDTGTVNATEDELDAVLSGTVTPQKIPVTVSIHTGPASAPDSIFDDASLTPRTRTSLLFRFPERAPITGLVDLAVSFNADKPRGVEVEVHGAPGSSLSGDTMEEIVRRGGLFGLPGRVWQAAA
ncbi:hypothetical protein PENSPDRAFT_590823 [Peniophora sp. CONT]|nr:hypothetical protein PENSPDRAFT_590823 [Peniophora sp. CONT]